MLKIPAKIWY